MTDTCDVPRCRQPSDLHYYHKEVCENHWKNNCNGEIDLKKIFKIKE